MTTKSTRSFHFLIAALVVVLDRTAKWAVAKNISLHDNIQIIPGFFRLTHVENRGAAFGLFADSPSEWKIAALVLFSIVALAIVSVLLWRNSHSMHSTGIGLALILGGAVGNLWDRLLSGRVVDFLLFYVGPVSMARLQCGGQRDCGRRRAAGDRNSLREISCAGKIGLKLNRKDRKEKPQRSLEKIFAAFAV